MKTRIQNISKVRLTAFQCSRSGFNNFLMHPPQPANLENSIRSFSMFSAKRANPKIKK
jgi:hypothetical protein